MEYRRLGKTGFWVSAVCLGGHWKRIDKVIGTQNEIHPYEGPSNEGDMGVFLKNRYEDLFSKKADPKDNCATCHAKKHSLKVRTRRWHKKTGKLIWSDGVRMMEEQPEAGLSEKDDRG